jgi:hypothetical protein
MMKLEEAIRNALNDVKRLPTNRGKVHLYPNGATVDSNVASRGHQVSSRNRETRFNEPEKMKSGYQKTPTVRKKLASISSKPTSSDRVIAMERPDKPGQHMVLDGHHRSIVAGRKKQQMNIDVVHHDDIHLNRHDYGDSRNNERNAPTLSSFRNRDGSYDMHKPRPSLGRSLKHPLGRSLHSYFYKK